MGRSKRVRRTLKKPIRFPALDETSNITVKTHTFVKVMKNKGIYYGGRKFPVPYHFNVIKKRVIKSFQSLTNSNETDSNETDSNASGDDDIPTETDSNASSDDDIPTETDSNVSSDDDIPTETDSNASSDGDI